MLWPLLSLALAVSALLGLLTARPAVDADSLYIPELWLRLQAGGSLGSWTLTPNPSLWPDLALWHGLQWFSPGVLPGLKAYGLASGLALIWLSARLLRALAPLGRWQSLGWCALGLGLGLALTPQGSFLTWLAPAHQGTPFLAALWLWCLVFEREDSAPSPLAWSLIVVMLGLVLGSSKFFALIGLIPALGLSLRSRQGLWLWLALPVVAVLAWLQVFWIKSTGALVPSFRWHYLWQNFAGQWGGFSQALPSLLRTDAGPLALAAFAGLGFWARVAWLERGAWARLLLAVALSAALGLGICLAMGSASGRFLSLFFWLPALWLPYLAARAWPSQARVALLVPLLAVLLWRAYLIPAGPQAPSWVRAQWLKEQAQSQGWQEGWAEYWDARPLRVLVDGAPKVLPVAPWTLNGKPVLDRHIMIVDRALFPTTDPPLPKPDFVVMNSLDPVVVQGQWGPPRMILQGPELILWVYAKERR